MTGENALQIVYVSTSWPWWWHALAIAGAAWIGLQVLVWSNRLLDWLQERRHRPRLLRRLRTWTDPEPAQPVPVHDRRPRSTPLSHIAYLPPLARRQARAGLHDATRPATLDEHTQ